jgi:hypothetical protein
VSCSLPDGEDCVTKPPHAESTQLFVEEFNPELAGKEWNVLNDSEPNSPLLVLRQLYNGRQQGLR